MARMAGAARVYGDPAHLLMHLDEVGVRLQYAHHRIECRAALIGRVKRIYYDKSDALREIRRLACAATCVCRGTR